MIDHHSHTHRELVKGKTIHVYKNGDLFFNAKSIVVNKKIDRTFEALLIRLTEVLKPEFGAVRHLKSVDGVTEITNFDQLEAGASYVAYGKKFSNLQYTEISARLQALAHPPLVSPRELRKLVVSGRARKIVRHPVVINVYANGQPFKSAKRVLLQPWIHKTWDNVLEQISSKLPHMRGAIRRLYELETKTQISHGTELQDQHYYVATGSEKFKDFEYGLSQTMFTPKQQMAKRYPTLPPIEPTERQQAKEKPNQSAPSESKRTYEPHPPPRRSEPKTEPKEEKGDDDPKQQRESYPISFQDTHPVSPIEEKKTPSSTTVGAQEESEKAQDVQSREVASPLGSPRPADIADGEENTRSRHSSSKKPDSPKADETPRADTPKVEDTPRADTPKVEDTPRADTPKVEDTPRADTPKVEDTPRADTPKVEDTPRADTPKVEETPRADTPKVEDTPRADTPKVEDTPRADTPKVEDTPRADTPKVEDTPRADTPKVEDTPRADTPKAEDTPRADTPKAEDTPRADTPKVEDTPRADTPKVEDTPRADTPKAEETPRADTPKVEDTPRADTPKVEETPRADTPKVEDTPRADTPKADENTSEHNSTNETANSVADGKEDNNINTANSQAVPVTSQG